jgi:hypothetical protein
MEPNGMVDEGVFVYVLGNYCFAMRMKTDMCFRLGRGWLWFKAVGLNIRLISHTPFLLQISIIYIPVTWV